MSFWGLKLPSFPAGTTSSPSRGESPVVLVFDTAAGADVGVAEAAGAEGVRVAGAAA